MDAISFKNLSKQILRFLKNTCIFNDADLTSITIFLQRQTISNYIISLFYLNFQFQLVIPTIYAAVSFHFQALPYSYPHIENPLSFDHDRFSTPVASIVNIHKPYPVGPISTSVIIYLLCYDCEYLICTTGYNSHCQETLKLHPIRIVVHLHSLSSESDIRQKLRNA